MGCDGRTRQWASSITSRVQVIFGPSVSPMLTLPLGVPAVRLGVVRRGLVVAAGHFLPPGHLMFDSGFSGTSKKKLLFIPSPRSAVPEAVPRVRHRPSRQVNRTHWQWTQ